MVKTVRYDSIMKSADSPSYSLIHSSNFSVKNGLFICEYKIRGSK
jgi:hypothetical protein